MLDRDMIEEKDVKKVLIDEYMKLVDVIQSYDVHFLNMKAWGVTLAGVVLSVGVAQDNVLVLIASFILSLSFWVTESWYKMIQNGHMQRAREIENALHSNELVSIKYPRILGSYLEKSEKNRNERKWLRMMFYSQVMYPHVFLSLLTVILLIRKIF